MGSKIIQINKSNKSNKIQAEIYRIHNSEDNTVHIRKDVDFNKFRTISVDVNNQQDEEILDQFVKSSPDAIVEDNQILKIQTCQPSIKNSVRRFWDRFTSFFHKPQSDTNNISNIPYPEYDIPPISDIKKKNEYIVDTRLWGIFASRCSYVWDKGYTGRGIVVAVLDTGLTNNPTPAFQNRILEGVNTCGSGKPTSDTTDKQGHSSNCSGIIGMNYNKLFGVAPECTILPIKVLGDEGVGSLDDIAEGLKYAMDLGADICSMSLGGGGYSQIFHNIIKEVTSKGIIIVCASGNETSAVGYPAAYPECIPVGAYNKYNKISYFSNFGPEMSGGLIAPGEDIIGIHIDGVHESVMSGTSQATPHVSGTCALLKQISKKCVTPEIARQALANGAVKILGVNVENQGNGKLDVPNTILQCSQLIKTKAQSISVKSNVRKFCRGSKGEIISQIQTKLKESGLYTDVIDGIYGRNTMDAVSKLTNGRSEYLDEVEYKKLLNKDFPDAFSRALQLIIDFEGTGYRNIIGNFDGSILTWGIIGFTLSHGEIPEILTEIDDKYPELLRKCFISGYSQLKAVIDKYRENKDLQLFKIWGYNIQEDNVVKSLYKTAFMKLGDEPAVREIQQQRAKNVYGTRAQKLMDKYGLSEDVSFALCFDCSVQGFNEKGQKVAASEISRKKYNETERRKIIALANSETCNPRWKKDVWRRRSLFVNRTGEIHGKKYDLGDWGF